MKQAKATVEEAETLLRWLQGQDTVDRQPPPYNRTIFGYLLMLEHCADPAKDYIDFKPGTSPDEIEALKQRAEAAEARVAELEKSLRYYSTVAEERKVRIAELEAQNADLRNAGGPPFIRSETIRNLKSDLCAAKMSAGRVHGQIGLLANAAFGISDNLDTTATLQAIEAGINDLKGRITQDHGIVSLLEAQNARLREALVRLDNIYRSELDGEDAPKRPAWLIAALNGEEAAP